MKDDNHARLWQLLELASRESEHLQGVVSRFFIDGELTVDWLDTVLATPEGIDRLESFVGKFARMQDTMMDKLLPVFLLSVGERTGTALDNLNLAQRLGFVGEPDAWLAMRRLRNRLVHEYVEDTAELAAALAKARVLVTELIECHRRLLAYSTEHIPHARSSAGSG